MLSGSKIKDKAPVIYPKDNDTYKGNFSKERAKTEHHQRSEFLQKFVQVFNNDK